MGLAVYASLIDPEAIILTGDMMVYDKWLMDTVRQTFDAHIFQNLRGKIELLISPLNNNERDLLGASALAWDVKEYSLFK
jgi:glucokinase